MKLRITVHGVAYEVDVEILDPGEGFPAPLTTHGPPPPVTPTPIAAPARAPAAGGAASAGAVAAPVAGTVIEIKCAPGDTVQPGQALLVVEAMKMNTTIAASGAGTVSRVLVAVGDAVREGQALVELG